MKVMQCWDDSVTNDIRLVKLLRRYRAKATFNFIITKAEGGFGKDWVYQDYAVNHLNLSEMKDLYQGFKVAGHGGRHFRQISYEEFNDEIIAVKQCVSAFFTQPECGYAYPGGGFDDTIKKLVRNAGYKYARTTKNVDGVLPLDDPFELSGHCHFASDDFAEKYARVKEADGIFYFWGHSYEFKDDETLWSDFERKLEFMAADDVEWIDIIDLF